MYCLRICVHSHFHEVIRFFIIHLFITLFMQHLFKYIHHCVAKPIIIMIYIVTKSISAWLISKDNTSI